MTNSPDPSIELRLAAMLLATQTLLYLTFPHLRLAGEFYAMTAAAVGMAGAMLWAERHRVERRTTHVINGLVLGDTLVEGILQPHIVPKPVAHNLYCVAAFAAVYIIWNAWPRSARRS